MKQKLLFLAAMMTATVMNLNATTATDVKYIDADGKEQTCETATVVEEATGAVTWNAGWYVVTAESVTLIGGATCSGDVHLILKDGAKLVAQSTTAHKTGINVTGAANSLTIYGQTGQTGQLEAKAFASAAAIGGGSKEDGSNITINGGIVTATGGNYAAGIGGGLEGNGSNITINGGTVTATGRSNAAGIGGGQHGSCSGIIINGGTVTATGGSNAAGIGGGSKQDGSNITVNGGIVTATGGNSGAGIGGGFEGNGSNITINGDTVTATGGKYAAGIGGGKRFDDIGGSGSNITINGGTVTATGGEEAAGIGGGWSGSASDIYVDPSLILKADGNNPPTTVIANSGADLTNSLTGKQYATVTEPVKEPDTLNYLHFVSLKEGDSIQLWKDVDTEPITVDLQYSTDNRKSWVDYQWDYYNGEIIPLTVDSSIWFRAGGDGINPTISINDNTLRVRFGKDDSIAVAGNIMSLYDATCKQDTMTKTGFRSLFSNVKGLVDASQLLLPASQLASRCYADMFQGCTNLTSIPSLRATTLAESCCAYMFYGCSKLQVDTMSESCSGAELLVPEMVDQPSYWNYWMFKGCQGAYADNIQPGGHYCIRQYVEPGPITDVENVNDNVNDNHNCKFLRNGQLYIRRGDAIYDAKGQVVK